MPGPGGVPTESDEGPGEWSERITATGRAYVITANTSIDAPDVGIVLCGAGNAIPSNHSISASPANWGVFVGIAVHR